MKEFKHSLDEKAEQALQTIIGRLNVGFYFPEAWIRVDREGVDVSSVSIPTAKDTFVVITCEWGDTLEDYIDIYYFGISVEDRPRDVLVTCDENGPCGWAYGHVSTIQTWDWTIIEKISIYELATIGTHESVRYDRAILFRYAKGEILVSAGGALSGRLEINHKPDVIQEILAPLLLRKENTDDGALQIGRAAKARLQPARPWGPRRSIESRS